jgi:hypothetical protein
VRGSVPRGGSRKATNSSESRDARKQSARRAEAGHDEPRRADASRGEPPRRQPQGGRLIGESRCAEAFHEAEAARRPTHRRVEAGRSNPPESRGEFGTIGGEWTQVEANHREGSRKAAGSSGSRDARKQSTGRRPQGDQLTKATKQAPAIHHEAQPQVTVSRTVEEIREQTTEKVAARRPTHWGVFGDRGNPRSHGADSIHREGSRKVADSQEASGKPTQPPKQQPPGTRFEGALSEARRVIERPSQGS